MSRLFIIRAFLAVCCVNLLTFVFVMAEAWGDNYRKPDQVGVASWYGAKYTGRLTAAGEHFDPADLTAAHAGLPFGTLVEVWRPEQGRPVVVRINDRGPDGGRIMDVSEAAARRLGLTVEGTAVVAYRVIGRAG